MAGILSSRTSINCPQDASFLSSFVGVKKKEKKVCPLKKGFLENRRSVSRLKKKKKVFYFTFCLFSFVKSISYTTETSISATTVTGTGATVAISISHTIVTIISATTVTGTDAKIVTSISATIMIEAI